MKVNGYKINPWANLEKANLRGVNLQWANLNRANLNGANLNGADLRGVNLNRADLSGANLNRADLSGADLYRADLYRADLYRADLYRADLRGANLSGANLSGANLNGADLRGATGISESVSAKMQVLPDEGDVIGWKKCLGGVIVKLLIKSGIPRSSATTRKCRAEEVTVLDVIGSDVGVSRHDESVEYRVGETVTCDKWDEDRWNECSGGIHFFITRQEAEDY